MVYTSTSRGKYLGVTMGYTTEFRGKFLVTPSLDDDTYIFLKKLSQTRRMKRILAPKYGVEGEFFVDSDGFWGQDEDTSVVDQNKPPSTQPGLWCQWTPTEDRQYLEWDGNEKFYNYAKWIEYLISAILKPRGFTVNGSVEWEGEDLNDFGVLRVVDNQVSMLESITMKQLVNSEIMEGHL